MIKMAICTTTIRKYQLNPGPEDITNGVIPRILGIAATYIICQFAGENNKWYMRRMNNGRVRDAGQMWLEDRNTLHVASSDPVIIGTIEDQPGVTFLGKYRKAV